MPPARRMLCRLALNAHKPKHGKNRNTATASQFSKQYAVKICYELNVILEQWCRQSKNFFKGKYFEFKRATLFG